MGAKLSVEVTDITWDTDGEDVPDLPTEMSFDVEFPDDPSETEINDAVADRMSDETGFCVKGFALVSTIKPDAAGGPSP